MEISDFCISTVLPFSCLNNNSANKFFDSLSMGTPIMVNHRGWQAKVIEKYDIGLVLSEFPENGDIERISALFQDKERLKNMCEIASQVAERNYGLNQALHKLDEVVNNII